MRLIKFNQFPIEIPLLCHVYDGIESVSNCKDLPTLTVDEDSALFSSHKVSF